MLDHLARDRCVQCLDAIVDRVSSVITDAAEPFGGAAASPAATALVLAYSRPDQEERVDALLTSAFRNAALDNISLFNRFGGSTWVAAHLARMDDSVDTSDIAAGYCRRASAFLDAIPPGTHFDLVFGLTGIGVVLLELATEDSGALLAKVVAALEAYAEPVRGGVGFRAPVEYHPNRRERFPEGAFDLGVAHGSAGVVAFLARLMRERSADASLVERASALLVRSVHGLMAQAFAEGEARYPCVIGDERPARAAWCYGDPGVAVALFAAADALRDEGLRKSAHELALLTTRRSEATSFIRDVGMCHGASGLAHIFGRLYAHTGDEAFLGPARHWLGRTLDLIEEGGITRSFAGKAGMVPEDNLLTGAIGVALALRSASGGWTDATWDRLLLLDLPPRS